MEYYAQSMNKAIYSQEHKRIANQLKKARINAGLSQIEASKLLGKTQSYISKIEAGQRRADIVVLRDFARIYNQDINFFIK